MWEIWDVSPTWVPGVEWAWDDYEVEESSRRALLLYSNPVDRYWELFSLPEDDLQLASRLDRVADRADDEFVRVLYVD
jgi:hypothetical protein